MRISTFTLLAFLLAPCLVCGALSTAELFSDLSSCALQCLSENVPAVGCGILDVSCQCASQKLTQLVTECMLERCTMDEALELVNIDGIQCNRPRNSRNDLIRGVAVASAVITFAAITLRVLARLWVVGALWLDDWCHILAGCFAIPMTIFANLCAQHGFGSHLYDIDTRYASNLLLWIYICQILWAIAIFLVKMSILLLYLRVFPGKSFRHMVLWCMGFLILTATVTITMAIFQCIPVNAIWDKDIKHARCLSISNIAYASAACNVATEIVIILLPLPVLKSLQLSGRKKLGLYALFSAGLLVIAVASVRISTLSDLATFNDPTFNNAPAFLWTCFETSVAHICAAAPMVRSALTKMLAGRGFKGMKFPYFNLGTYYESRKIRGDPEYSLSSVATVEKVVPFVAASRIDLDSPGRGWQAEWDKTTPRNAPATHNPAQQVRNLVSPVHLSQMIRQKPADESPSDSGRQAT